MAADQEQPDDADDAQLAWLLTSAHDAPAMRGEFQRELAERLDAEFAAARAEFVGRNGKVTHTIDGAVPKIKPAQPPAARRPRRRWMVGVALAASLMMAVAVWADPPRWSAALRAIVREIGQWTGSVEAPAPKIIPTIPTEPHALVEPAPPVDVVARSQRPRPTAPEKKPAPQTAHSVVPTNEPLWQPKLQDNLSKRIDEQLAALWASQGIYPVGPSDDAEFMRRVFLDLTGRIPTVSEVHAFMDDPAPDRRERLVDRLLAHRDHATHLAAQWRQILVPDDVDLSRYGGTAGFERVARRAIRGE